MATRQKLKDYKRLDKRTKLLMLMLEASRNVIENETRGDGIINFKSAKLNTIKREIKITYDISHES